MDVAVHALTSLIKPFIIVFLGSAVGSIILAMYLPIFKTAGAISVG